MSCHKVQRVFFQLVSVLLGPLMDAVSGSNLQGAGTTRITQTISFFHLSKCRPSVMQEAVFTGYPGSVRDARDRNGRKSANVNKILRH